MSTKDFDGWNEVKKSIDASSQLRRYYHEREIWWCSLGVNIGHEYDGKNIEYRRPVLILKGLSNSSCLIVPLTTSANTHRFRIKIGLIEGREAAAVISQIKVIDTKRLSKKICNLDSKLFEHMRKVVKDLL
jgi:mRNA interferase MazF